MQALRRSEIRWVLGVWLALLVVPYLIAWRTAGQDWVFSGLLFNPLDGHTYLAKMRQGWDGAWTYRLAFTPQPGEGRALFLFYLLGGHLARGLGVPLPWMLHGLRLSGAVVLFLVLVCWLDQTLAPDARRLALVLAAFGGGLGWLAWPFGYLPADFWVAEAYPFLSALTNAHFPWALALLLALMLPEGHLASGGGWRAAVAFLLGWISPFGVVLAAAVDAAMIPWSPERRRWLGRSLAVAAGGLVPLGYTWWAVHSQPVLAGWNAQNLTPSLPWWDLLLAFSPALVLALGLAMFPRLTAPEPAYGGRRASLRLALVWAAVALALVFVPWNLQRRLLMGLMVPVSTLTAHVVARWRPLFRRGLVTLALPTNLILIAAAIFAAVHHNPHLYLSRAEADALAWVEAHMPLESVVVASPELGAFIPGQTGRFVVYGHPFESVPAETNRQALVDFYTGRLGLDWLRTWSPVVVLYGPREQALGSAVPRLGLPLLYANDEVSVYGPPR